MRLLLILFIPCALYAKGSSGAYTTPELDEFRIEIEDLKHALKTTQVELGLLDERLKKQDTPKAQNKDSFHSAQISALEKKVAGLEKTLEKAAHDLRTLNGASTQTLSKIQELESEVASHEKRLEEVVKLKGALTNISKAISPLPSSTKSYRVKAGDSLEKIARKHGTTAETIRKLNNLPNDKIVIGQDLRIPDDST
jgi:LysM repeat protein